MATITETCLKRYLVVSWRGKIEFSSIMQALDYCRREGLIYSLKLKGE